MNETPWYQPFASSLTGALVGGALAIAGGYISARRVRLNDRQRNVESVGAKYIATIRQMLNLIATARQVSNGVLIRFDFDQRQVVDILNALIGVTTELEILIAGSPLQITAGRAYEAFEAIMTDPRAAEPVVQKLGVETADACETFAKDLYQFSLLKPTAAAKYLDQNRRHWAKEQKKQGRPRTSESDSSADEGKL